MLDPLHQFEIHPLIPIHFGKLDLSFTNASLTMVLVCLAICLFLHWTTRKKALIPDKGQSLCEQLFHFVSNTLSAQLGDDGPRYIAAFFTLFVFILFANLAGLLPYSFTVTSHLAVTFTLAMFVFIGMTLVGFARHGLGFFHAFLPSGVPGFIAPLLIPVEVVSYVVRPVSLSMMLFANMVAGHIVLKIVACAAVVCASTLAISPLALFPIGINIILTVFEVFVAVLQAYVFTILSSIYLNSVISLH